MSEIARVSSAQIQLSSLPQEVLPAINKFTKALKIPRDVLGVMLETVLRSAILDV